MPTATYITSFPKPIAEETAVAHVAIVLSGGRTLDPFNSPLAGFNGLNEHKITLEFKGITAVANDPIQRYNPF